MRVAINRRHRDDIIDIVTGGITGHGVVVAGFISGRDHEQGALRTRVDDGIKQRPAETAPTPTMADDVRAMRRDKIDALARATVRAEAGRAEKFATHQSPEPIDGLQIS